MRLNDQIVAEMDILRGFLTACVDIECNNLGNRIIISSSLR